MSTAVSVDFSLRSLLASTCATAPERAAIVDGGRTITYAALDAAADGVAAGLRRDGVGAGERLAFLADHPAAYLTVLIGSARAGVVSIPLNSRLAPAEVEGILADSGAAVLVTTRSACDRLAELTVRRVVLLDDDTSSGLMVPWSDWLGGPDAPAPSSIPGDGVVLQMYTSGTTGRPKGVLLTDDNLAASIPEMCGLWGLDATARMLGVLPLFHIAGLGAAVGTLWSGGTLVVARAPSATAILADIAVHRITNVVLASVLLQRVIEEAATRIAAGEAVDLSSLRVVGYGAAPISQQILRDALRVLPCGLLQVYGLTECAGTISVLRPEDHDPDAPDRLRSCGRPLDSLELRLVSPTEDIDVADGEVGEIWVRSRRVTQGYWNAPEATADTVTAAGWLRTGDLAFADGDGYLYLCDRLRDMIISGGENIYPAEVEDVLQAHPSVAEVAVVGVPDDRWGETPRAVVVAAPGSTVDPAALIDFARARLAHFKCPAAIDVVAELPRNATGKVLRRALREPYWAGRARLVN